MKAPRYSILLPTHNRADVLDPAMRSVLGQTRQDFELLVVGDGCTDNTKDVVASFADERIRWFDLPKAPHFGYANRNAVLREARGELVAYMAHDDLWLPDHLELLARVFEKDGVNLAYTMPLWVAPDGAIAPLDFDLGDPGTLTSFLAMERNSIPSMCVAHRRDCLDRFGYWNERRDSSGDWDLCIRVIKGGGRQNFAYVREPTSLHFRAIWKTEQQAGPPELCVWRVLHEAGELPPAMRVAAPEGSSQQHAFWKKMSESHDWPSELRAATHTALLKAAEGGPRKFFFFQPQDLLARAARYHDAFHAATPFPHIVIDDFMPNDVAERLLDEYPMPSTFKAESSKDDPRRTGKLRSRSEADFTPFMRQTLEHFNSALFLDFLTRISGIQGLTPDPDIAGALRHFGRGGRLGVHADFNFHPGLQMYRRLNIILYMNKDWKPEYRGDFELWDAKVTRCEKSIAPLFNRALLFTATDGCYHGFPKPLKCPEGATRKSIQFYYYSKAPPPGNVTSLHGTEFRWRPQDLFNPERWVHAARALARRT